MYDIMLTPVSPVEPDILDITYRSRGIVGTVITSVSRDSLTVVELAVDEPGIVNKGFLSSLISALEDLAKEKGLSNIKIEYMYQHRKMYEAIGFTESFKEGEFDVLVRPIGGNLDTARGACYQDAWRFLIKEEEGFLVHGSVQLSPEAPRVNHAWVELLYGWVWEPQTKSYYTIEDFKITGPVEEQRYTCEEAAIMVARVGKHGPWTEEERSAWLTKPKSSSIYPPRIGVIPKLPEEARGDFLFFEYIKDLCKYEALSEEDAQRLWEGWEKQRGR